MDFQRTKCYFNTGESMSARPESATAAHIRRMAREYRVAYVRSQHDTLAHHLTRLAGVDVELDEIEQLLIALQRGGYLTRAEMVQLQASYLREIRL
jgi:hypothetical protein